MADIDAELAALKTEVKYLKWIIPAGCGFVALLVLIFWNIERHNIGDRVRTALDAKGVQTAINSTREASKEASEAVAQIHKIKNQLPWSIIQISSVDHSSKIVGQYFNFDIIQIDNAIGHAEWSKKNFLVVHSRTSKIAPAVLWRSSNGGSTGSGHGRWVSGAAPQQWEVGDKFIIIYAPEKL